MTGMCCYIFAGCYLRIRLHALIVCIAVLPTSEKEIVPACWMLDKRAMQDADGILPWTRVEPLVACSLHDFPPAYPMQENGTAAAFRCQHDHCSELCGLDISGKT